MATDTRSRGQKRGVTPGSLPGSIDTSPTITEVFMVQTVEDVETVLFNMNTSTRKTEDFRRFHNPESDFKGLNS